MTTSVVPELIDTLVTYCTDWLPHLRVSDGVGVTDDPSDYLMIGVDDPFASSDNGAVESEQDWAHVGLGAQRTEEGTVMCAALSWSGNANPKEVRDRVYATYAAVAGLMNEPATTDLGVEGLLWTSCGTRSRLVTDQNEHGALALLTFQIFFKAQF